MVKTPATPDSATGKTILGTMPRIIALVSVLVAAIVAAAIPIYSKATFESRQAERVSQLSELIAPDLAWRETDRLTHIFDNQLGGNALALDAAGNVVVGNEALADSKKFAVHHDGALVGYIIAPGIVDFRVSLPFWLVLWLAVFGVFVCVASARFISARISTSVEELSDYANAFGASKDALDVPQGEFDELTTLRIAMEKAAQRTRKEAARLRGAAFADPITGLPNRNVLREAIATNAPSLTVEAPGAYVLLNLDGYMRASDSFGPGGDKKILSAAIDRMQDVLADFEGRGVHTLLASLQADNFGVFLKTCPNGRDDVSDILRRLNVAFQAPLAVDNRLLTLGISGGITMLPEDGTALDELQRRAMMAMEEARKAGPNSFQFFAPRFDRIAKGRFQLEAELRKASANGEFVPVFQPKIDFASGRIIGAEALARWRREGGKVVMPGTFIGVAEEIGLIEEIGRQILEASCRAAAKWTSMGFDVTVAVNVSPRQFEQRDFTETVMGALQRSGVPPHLLELEITESMAVEDPHKVAEVMHPLREMGVRLAIDDFGTGHSNLAMLTQLPFDVFKIDRQFVSALQKDRQAPAIVEMILAMAETLGLKTVAEGVETPQQADFLRRRGCTLGQGFLYSPGVPLDKFVELLHTWRRQDPLQQHQGIL